MKLMHTRHQQHYVRNSTVFHSRYVDYFERSICLQFMQRNNVKSRYFTYDITVNQIADLIYCIATELICAWYIKIACRNSEFVKVDT